MGNVDAREDWSAEQLIREDEDAKHRCAHPRSPVVALYVAAGIAAVAFDQLVPEVPIWAPCIFAVVMNALLLFGVPASMRFIDTCPSVEKGGPGLMWWAGAAVAALMPSVVFAAIATGVLICWLLADAIIFRKRVDLVFRKRLAVVVFVLCDALFAVNMCLCLLA